MDIDNPGVAEAVTPATGWQRLHKYAKNNFTNFNSSNMTNKELKKLMDKFGIHQDIRDFHKGFLGLICQYKAEHVPKPPPTQELRDEEPPSSSHEQARGTGDSAPGEGL